MLQRGRVAEEAEGLLDGPAEGVEELPGVHHLLEPGTALRRALHGEKEREEAGLVGGAGVLAERLPEGEVLGLAVSREAAGIGGEKGERGLFVAAVLGEVEVDAPDEVPGRVEGLEEVLEGGA